MFGILNEEELLRLLSRLPFGNGIGERINPMESNVDSLGYDLVNQNPKNMTHNYTSNNNKNPFSIQSSPLSGTQNSPLGNNLNKGIQNYQTPIYSKDIGLEKNPFGALVRGSNPSKRIFGKNISGKK